MSARQPLTLPFQLLEPLTLGARRPGSNAPATQLRHRALPGVPICAASRPNSRSSTTPSRWPPIAIRARPGGPGPTALPIPAAPGSICLNVSWLQSLKVWSLRETRGSSCMVPIRPVGTVHPGQCRLCPKGSVACLPEGSGAPGRVWPWVRGWPIPFGKSTAQGSESALVGSRGCRRLRPLALRSRRRRRSAVGTVREWLASRAGYGVLARGHLTCSESPQCWRVAVSETD